MSPEQPAQYEDFIDEQSLAIANRLKRYGVKREIRDVIAEKDTDTVLAIVSDYLLKAGKDPRVELAGFYYEEETPS